MELIIVLQTQSILFWGWKSKDPGLSRCRSCKEYFWALKPVCLEWSLPLFCSQEESSGSELDLYKKHFPYCSKCCFIESKLSFEPYNQPVISKRTSTLIWRIVCTKRTLCDLNTVWAKNFKEVMSVPSTESYTHIYKIPFIDYKGGHTFRTWTAIYNVLNKETTFIKVKIQRGSIQKKLRKK